MEALIRELKGSHRSFAADLSVPEGIDAAASELASETPDLLINNAGFGTKGLFWEAPFDEQVRMHRVHIDATLALTRAVLPGMVARDSGAVINVASVAGFLRSPGSVSYCATKAWINAFSEGVYLDLKKKGSRVAIQSLCPGFTYSEFYDTMGVGRGTVPKWLWMSANDVVDDSLAALEKLKLFVVPGWPYKLIVGLIPKLPVGMRLRIEGSSPQSRNRV